MEPQIHTDEHGLNEITDRIINCVFTVANTLGCGFLEKVYENALAHELRKAGLQIEQQKSMQIVYDGAVVGDYVADLLVNNAVLVEVRAIKAIDDVHFAQCLNYLKATKLRLCLLINFGAPRVSIKRIIND